MLAGVVALGLMHRVSPVHLPEAQAKPASAIAADAASAKKTAQPDGWVGVIVAGYTAELAADAEGRVSQVFVRTGAHVAEKEKLLQFDEADATTAFGMASAELSQRGSELARAQARAEAAKAQLGRVKASEQWLSTQEKDTAISESRVADADLRAARAAVGVGQARLNQQKLVMSRRTLVAPFAGTVVGLGVDPGDSVTPGQIVLRVLSEDRQIRFAFPPSELQKTAIFGKRVTIQLGGTTLAVTADVSAVRPEVDPSAQLVFASAPLPDVLPEAQRWIPGAAVDVHLSDSTSISPAGSGSAP
jgi:multidrug efflux pump subunit AcrA (membrane-fusion protein)